MQIIPLTGDHDRQSFDCGIQELNGWLRQVARQHQDKGLSKTFVAVDEAQPTQVCGYYALTLAELENRHLPDAWRKKLPRRIPGVRLGRLAIEKILQNKGLGGLLLIDALMRTQRIYTEAGGYWFICRCHRCTSGRLLSTLWLRSLAGQSAIIVLARGIFW